MREYRSGAKKVRQAVLAAQHTRAPHHARPLAQQVRQQNRELYSLRCDFMHKLRVAQENRDEPALYFPHNVDFRGRAYTMHPHLNHLGAD